ncbi:hypothetical protein [Actinokineospora inagensis]|uniref:hypothetical protein n=1 Tax=Actinokineospora inagensis TaxID=103730 RepID=UPI00047A2DA0|nr:hypothetical protein [Actinokineospora inagensis]
MTVGERFRYAGLLAASVVLGIFELFFLPLRLDGRVLPDIAELPFPITVVVAGLTLPWLVVRAGRIRPRAAFAGGPLYAWLATFFVFVVVAPGGDSVIIPDWRTLLLLAAGAFPATVKIGDVLARSVGSSPDSRPK